MRIIYFLSFLLFFNLSFGKNDNDLLVDSKYTIDVNSSWKSNSLKTKQFIAFNKDHNISIGYNKNATVWCWFKIRNRDTKNSIQTWLCFDNNHIDSLVFYDGNRIEILGDRTSNSSSFISSLAFKILLKPNESKTYYVKVKKGISFLEFNYKFLNEKTLQQKSKLRIAIISFFLGIIFLLILFNSILWHISKKKLYAYYLFSSFLSAVYLMISTNYAKHLLFTDFLYFSELKIYIASLWFISVSIFLSHFLDLRRYQPMKYKIIITLNLINITLVIVTLTLLIINVLNPLRLLMFIGYINFLIVYAIVIWATLSHFKIDRKSAGYVLLSFFPQIIWGIVIILRSFQLIPKNNIEDWLVIICLYEVLLFGYILTKNYVETLQKNNELIREITAEKENSIQAITQVQIRERRNIANVIHDIFGSKIAYIMHLLELKNFPLANVSIQELANDIRDISHQILPKSLDDGALFSSLQSQIVTLNNGLQQTKIEIFGYDFPEKIETKWVCDVYLISLEIINNALKHGKSTNISIELFGYPDNYIFQYTDNGIGYDIKSISKGFGLENIEKRVLFYKGTFEINSNINQGTVIQISIPKSK